MDNFPHDDQGANSRQGPAVEPAASATPVADLWHRPVEPGVVTGPPSMPPSIPPSGPVSGGGAPFVEPEFVELSGSAPTARHRSAGAVAGLVGAAIGATAVIGAGMAFAGADDSPVDNGVDSSIDADAVGTGVDAGTGTQGGPGAVGGSGTGVVPDAGTVGTPGSFDPGAATSDSGFDRRGGPPGHDQDGMPSWGSDGGFVPPSASGGQPQGQSGAS